ncbi:hypothetical protein LY28_03717 [Ruminiclostridium sufflavum DSM 19573]|uniref:Uncharacterized protein n=1 Tax=Ruminiclostridium sufflavum DSM 19573 TaxID=1121337 RepID=A0A318XIH7_9FIRM|nr:hypothetical protein [Ruminiclostridium sufflavum]PYG84265.1 hypothetical protein LY28_03717 [Ruminiclostridium sufflavum DSM 19573]
MDNMSILKLILVTVPESILNIYIALLMTGERLKLPIKCYGNKEKENIIRLIIAVALFTFVQFIGRAYISDLFIYTTYNIISSIIILRFVYFPFSRFDKDKKLVINIINILNNWKKPAIQVCIIFFVIITIENLYLPLILKILNITTYSEVYKIPWANLVIPQVDRFFQLLIISFLWDLSRVNNNILKTYKCNKVLFLMLFLYMLIFEFSVSYLYLRYFNVYSNPIKIFFFILLASMSIINIYVYKATLNLVDKTYLHSKKGGLNREKASK